MSRNVTYAPTGNRGTVISARTRSDLDSRLREHGPATVIILPPGARCPGRPRFVSVPAKRTRTKLRRK